MSHIIVTPEYWAQPGAVRYTYVNKRTKAVANVGEVSEDSVLLWSINAWGSTSQWRCSLEDFRDCYEEIEDKRSMYERMDEAAGRSREHLLDDDEVAMLNTILMTYCEDSDSSEETAEAVDALWSKLKDAVE